MALSNLNPSPPEEADPATYHPVSPLPNRITELREHLVTFFRQYFAWQEPPLLFWQDPQQGQPLSEYALTIADAFPEQASGIQQQPAILVERQAVARPPTGMDNDRVIGSITDDRVQRSWGFVCPIAIHCLSRVSLQAEDLQWLVHAVLSMYFDQIAAQVDWIEHLDDFVLQPPQAVDPEGGLATGYGDFFDAPVQCQFNIRSTFVEENDGAPFREMAQFTQLQG